MVPILQIAIEVRRSRYGAKQKCIKQIIIGLLLSSVNSLDHKAKLKQEELFKSGVRFSYLGKAAYELPCMVLFFQQQKKAWLGHS
jgi:hypothetical protein